MGGRDRIYSFLGAADQNRAGLGVACDLIAARLIDNLNLSSLQCLSDQALHGDGYLGLCNAADIGQGWVQIDRHRLCQGAKYLGQVNLTQADAVQLIQDLCAARYHQGSGLNVYGYIICGGTAAGNEIHGQLHLLHLLHREGNQHGLRFRLHQAGGDGLAVGADEGIATVGAVGGIHVLLRDGDLGVIHLTDQLLLAADGNGIRREGEVTALEAFGHAAVKGALNRDLLAAPAGNGEVDGTWAGVAYINGVDYGDGAGKIDVA